MTTWLMMSQDEEMGGEEGASVGDRRAMMSHDGNDVT